MSSLYIIIIIIIDDVRNNGEKWPKKMLSAHWTVTLFRCVSRQEIQRRKPSWLKWHRNSSMARRIGEDEVKLSVYSAGHTATKRLLCLGDHYLNGGIASAAIENLSTLVVSNSSGATNTRYVDTDMNRCFLANDFEQSLIK